MKTKVIKSLLIPVLGIPTLATVAQITTACGEKKDESITPSDAKVAKITFEQPELTLYVGEWVELKYSIEPANATNAQLEWAIDNGEYASLQTSGDKRGVFGIKPKEDGPLTITLSTRDRTVSATCKVSVELKIINVKAVSLDRTEMSLGVGQDDQLIPIFTPENATNKNIIWTSDNETIATVDQDGTVHALKEGIATITAKTEDGNRTAKCKVTIKAPIVLVKSIELESTLALTEGETDQLIAKVLPEEATNKNIIWTSNNETVATVNKNGLVTALKEGFATIIASAEDGSGIEAKCTVTVSPITVYATGIELSATSFELVEGKTQQLTATISPENATNKNVIWSSSNEEIATVDAKTGLVKAVAPGEAVIKVIAADGSGITVECKVTVKAQIFAVEGVTLRLPEARFWARRWCCLCRNRRQKSCLIPCRDSRHAPLRRSPLSPPPAASLYWSDGWKRQQKFPAGNRQTVYDGYRFAARFCVFPSAQKPPGYVTVPYRLNWPPDRSRMGCCRRSRQPCWRCV